MLANGMRSWYIVRDMNHKLIEGLARSLIVIPGIKTSTISLTASITLRWWMLLINILLLIENNIKINEI